MHERMKVTQILFCLVQELQFHPMLTTTLMVQAVPVPAQPMNVPKTWSGNDGSSENHALNSS